MNTNKKLKFGRGGKRNRQRRNRMMRRRGVIHAHGFTAKDFSGLPVKMPNSRNEFLTTMIDMGKVLLEEQTIIDLSGPWNEEVAKQAFDLWSKSGKTQKEFATEHNFPFSRFRSWKSRIAA